jgi:hypothetical protein
MAAWQGEALEADGGPRRGPAPGGRAHPGGARAGRSGAGAAGKPTSTAPGNTGCTQKRGRGRGTRHRGGRRCTLAGVEEMSGVPASAVARRRGRGGRAPVERIGLGAEGEEGDVRQQEREG